MKAAVVCLFALMMVGSATRAAEAPTANAQPALKVKIAVPERGEVVAIDEHSHFHVVIENTSDESQNIIDEWNSWGYYNLHFEYATGSGQRQMMEKQLRAWKANYLSAVKLPPGAVSVWDVYLSDKTWSNLPVPERGERSVRIRAVFEQAPIPGEMGKGLWQGRVESPEVELTFRKAG